MYMTHVNIPAFMCSSVCLFIDVFEVMRVDTCTELTCTCTIYSTRRMHGIAGRAVASGVRAYHARAMNTCLGRRALNLATLCSTGNDLVGLGLERPSYL